MSRDWAWHPALMEGLAMGQQWAVPLASGLVAGLASSGYFLFNGRALGRSEILDGLVD